jgi:TnpA family transposase
MFYVDGINVQTKILRYGQNDVITIYSNKEGTYNYYDGRDTATKYSGKSG